MKTYEITIKPLSGFGTPLKGDTLFGQVCWQAAYDASLFGMTIDELLADYAESPFLVVSTAFPKVGRSYALRRPSLPLDSLFDFEGLDKRKMIETRKLLKARKWMLAESGRPLRSLRSAELYKNDKELFDMVAASVPADLQRDISRKGGKAFVADFSQPHNTINRLTGTTGEGGFAPFAVEQQVYMQQAELALFVGVSEKIAFDGVVKALRRIGDFGFGKDASTGLGKFEVCGTTEIDLKALGSENPNALYTLAPCVPERNRYPQMFYTPFTRFGRHGDVLAKSRNPFKNPVIMADEGAVFSAASSDIFQKACVGTAVTGISLSEPRSVAQGYSLYIPVRVEV